MSELSQKPREHWSGSLGFVLAAAGSAIGLGNIWKFPYITGENGGGAFVLVYLLCIAVIGLPVMICEITLGRRTQRNPVGAYREVSPPTSLMAHGIGLAVLMTGTALLFFQTWGWATVLIAVGLMIFRYGWRLAGVLGVVAGFVILSFYSVVAGWTIGYLVDAVLGRLSFDSVPVAKEFFGRFITDPLWAIGCHLVFMGLCIAIVYGGVQRGIERWSKVLMPLLFLLLVVLIIRAVTLPGAIEGIRFYLRPDFSRINAGSVLIALGHAFFSLSLGMGAMITYGSYLRREQNIFSSALTIVVLDTLIALMAGFAIFPAVFAYGFGPDAGPGLVFQVLPTVFHRMPLGAFWAALFFLLLLVAALTSGISLLEVVTAYFVDERKWPRPLATLVNGGVIAALGVLCAISVADWSRIEGLHRAFVWAFGGVKGSFFDLADNLASNWFLPLGGLLICLFVGWVWGTKRAVDEIRHGSSNFADVHLISLLAGLKDDPSHNLEAHVLTLASLWGIFIRFISPVAVLIAFLHTVGWLDLRRPSAPAAPATAQAVSQPDQPAHATEESKATP